MKKTSTIVERFLQEMKSSGSSGLLDDLIEELEIKEDPDPADLYLLETLYQFKEKLKITEAKLSSYLIKSRESLPGNKLSDLYDSLNGYGTSKLFKD
jgi:hypothetical protein